MPATRANTDGTAEAFRTQIRIAAARYRLERLARASRPIAWTLAVSILAVLILSLVSPLVALGWQISLALVVAALISAVVIYLLGFDQHRLFVRMDAQGRLPDSVLSAGDWEDVSSDPWRDRQRAETLGYLAKIDWRKAWPVKWPRLTWLPLVTALLLVATIWLVQQQWLRGQMRELLAEEQAKAPVSAKQLKPLEEIFKDWDAAQKIAPSPELAKLLDQLKPMRDDMNAGKMTEKELFLKLNEVQARIQAQKDRVDANSLAPMAQSLADAVKDLDGMSGLAAALQRKDFAAAKEQAAAAADKYNKGEAKTPQDQAAAQAAADRLAQEAKKAEQMAHDQQAAAGLKKMQDALAKKDQNQNQNGKQDGSQQTAKNGDKQNQQGNQDGGQQTAKNGDKQNQQGNQDGSQSGSQQLAKNGDKQGSQQGSQDGGQQPGDKQGNQQGSQDGGQQPGDKQGDQSGGQQAGNKGDKQGNQSGGQDGGQEVAKNGNDGNQSGNQDGQGNGNGGSGKEMGSGLGDLQNSLGEQAARDAQSQGFGTQLAQLNSFMNGMGQGDGSGMDMSAPHLSLAKSMQPGHGAGSTIDPNRVGEATQIDASHQEVKITGTPGAGPGQSHTESTNDPHSEVTAGSVTATQFSAYEKLSEQATEDENLPVADRQMIKRYFEDIRPQTSPNP